jgi:hypothetical protein
MPGCASEDGYRVHGGLACCGGGLFVKDAVKVASCTCQCRGVVQLCNGDRMAWALVRIVHGASLVDVVIVGDVPAELAGFVYEDG